MNTNICKTGQFDSALFYHSVCDCLSRDHSQEIVLEILPDGLGISCTLYQDLEHTDMCYNKNLIERIYTRIKNCLKYLFTGQLTVSGEHLLVKEEHIRDYANALLEGIDELKRRRLSSLQEDSRN
jgi:hypothetical protein